MGKPRSGCLPARHLPPSGGVLDPIASLPKKPCHLIRGRILLTDLDKIAGHSRS